ncbi:MAG: hypothetical protein KatS3mg105_2284 [Gemmatales bacterium]|nr:MAG: hypothetical protein KatS3mg105_2284 [Gemmatales bacterium]
MKARRIAVLVAAGIVICLRPVWGAETGYQKKVGVSAATRLDWVYAVSNQSRASEKLPQYDSTKQAYELYVPEDYNANKKWPVILFLSAGDRPAGWKQFQAVCQKHGILFASPYGAGNGTEQKKRVRIVLDVLDDLCRRYHTDPDRTYLGGFSGGARIASAVASALPEYFGGVIGVCASGPTGFPGGIREETYLQHRVIERLSVALVTGENDFNRAEIERWRGPLLQGIGVDVRVWVVKGMGHGIPGGGTLEEVWQWLEQGVGRRRKFAERYPAMRIDPKNPPTREAWAKMLFDEAQERMKQRGTFYSGLMQLNGLRQRWPDLPIAKEALKIVVRYDSLEKHFWREYDIASQRRFLLSQARGLASYATGPLPKVYEKERIPIAKAALKRWQFILQDAGAESKVGQEAKSRIAELEKLIGEQ